MRVVSLFDGKSCGRIALERANIKVRTYYASEIDKYAIQVSQDNYPEIIQLGDVTEWRGWDIDWSSIDLLIGGSPCQGFSFAGKQLAFDDPRSKLFFVYVDILNHIKLLNPNIKFMLENVKMKKEYMAVISEYLGVEPVFINSALVSAQNRQRYYWANWEFGEPEDRGVMLADILEPNLPSCGVGGRIVGRKINSKGKASCLTGGAHSGGNHSDMDILVIQKPRGFNKGGIKAKNGKTPTLSSCSWQHNNHLMIDSVIRRFTTIECERLQTVPDNYTSCVSNTQRYKMLGNGWTIDVIAHIFGRLND